MHHRDAPQKIICCDCGHERLWDAKIDQKFNEYVRRCTGAIYSGLNRKFYDLFKEKLKCSICCSKKIKLVENYNDSPFFNAFVSSYDENFSLVRRSQIMKSQILKEMDDLHNSIKQIDQLIRDYQEDSNKSPQKMYCGADNDFITAEYDLRIFLRRREEYEKRLIALKNSFSMF